ncbi:MULTISPECIES: DUF5682 family protein [unclassified Novosphingobium]|uniref:DUF5682 family protein n=1 Tax=unclassified Novosphingobium TaxID=2644732 RepID=UPI00146EF5B6|nr:hypothetical protein [Novosphingobium sp. SG919]NMN87774.1 hypothetical protein [Novosphingobium sp. SG916]
MVAPVSYFGIRHHGPGSARRLVEALDDLRPCAVLIEGPADATHLLSMLADPALETPVALLTYAQDDPSRASFFPFAEYSPEFQAARWSLAHGADLLFIDLPAADRLAEEDNAAPEIPPNPIAQDPIGSLAQAAGYDDGESWWADVIEQNPSPGPVFAAVADAMTALRRESGPLPAYEAAREAHMRIEIARVAKDSPGPVAVVCGAWHVPALAEKHSLAADRALLKGRAKVKIKATWAPWTTPRLAYASGYGAGVAAPGWCAHVWHSGGAADSNAVWLAKIAHTLRERGHFVSTAALIEAQRLGTALAAMRGRPTPGFEEMREATIACLCHGERAVWDDIAAQLLVGSGVGVIPSGTPLAPLLEDLARQQKATRLKPEALERALTLDLRSESGLARSALLHRLTALGIPWGRLTDAGRSRGTFRENWLLRWEPEYAVRLVENLVHGSTIAEAAANCLLETMRGEGNLGMLARLVRDAMIADLPRATDAGIALMEEKAALTSDCPGMLVALPPMADVLRYGEARAGTVEHLAALMPRIVVQASLALAYAARNLDAEAAAALREAILAADGAITLAELGGDIAESWYTALAAVIADQQATRLVSGAAARLLFEADRLPADEAATLLSRMLSPGTPVAEAAGFFEGFFDGMGQRLIHDDPLRDAVDAWISALEEEAFVASLPLLRRVFSRLDKAERRRLADAALGRDDVGGGRLYRLLPAAATLWPAHEARVLALLQAGAPA